MALRRLIDEADEIKRAAQELLRNAGRAQLQTLSPPERIEDARTLEEVTLPRKELQKKVRDVAQSYVRLATENRRLYQEFLARYVGRAPGASDPPSAPVESSSTS